ncbi:MAG: hypothetical protein AB2692_23270 [Candidatus Thiodiazotropha sp.]
MENNEDSNWYHGVLTGAKKFIDTEEKADVAATLAEQTKPVVVIEGLGEQNAEFCKLMSHASAGILREAFAKQGFVEGMKSWVSVKASGKEFHIVVDDSVQDADAISEEEIEDKIASQLSAVLDESVEEFRELRNQFKETSNALHEEFNEKFLQLSQRSNGEAQ